MPESLQSAADNKMRGARSKGNRGQAIIQNCLKWTNYLRQTEREEMELICCVKKKTV